MQFSISKQKFVCSSCNTMGDMATLTASIKEYDFDKYLEREKESVAFEGMAVVSCHNCGFEISFDEHQVATTCPMCSSTQIAATKQKGGIPPEGIIPFKIDKKDAQQKFKQWVKSRWFAPNDFKSKFGEGLLTGLYLPFWTYDAAAFSTYKGEGGNNRTVKEKDGKEKTVTDWFPVSGVVNAEFDDVQVCASEKEKNIEGILPYDTIHNAKPYAAEYLSGYYAEIYKIKADQGFDTAKTIMEKEMQNLARDNILQQYDEAQVHDVQTKYTNVTYKHVLLPLWSSAFGYKGETYNYIVNGETGKVSGNRPYSMAKIAAAVIAVIIAVIIAFSLFSGNDDAYTYAELSYSVQETAADHAYCLEQTSVIQNYEIGVM